MKVDLTRHIQLVDGGAPTIYYNDLYDGYLLYTAAPIVLTGNLNVVYSGTPIEDVCLTLRYEATITPGVNAFRILGTEVPDSLLNKQFTALARYNATTAKFEVQIIPDFEETDMIDGDALVDASVSIVDKLSAVAQGTILIGDAANRPSALAIGAATRILVSSGVTLAYKAFHGDMTIDADADVTIAANAITSGKILDNAVTLAKLVDFSGQGYLIRGGAAGAPEEFDASGNQQILIGNGTTINSVALTGPITISNVGLTAIASNSITVAMLSTANSSSLKKELIVYEASFESGEYDAANPMKILIPFKCTATNVYGIVKKLIEATNNGTIQLQDNAGNNMTGGLITATAGDTIGTEYAISAITGNNAFTAGQYMLIDVSKTTAGGKVLVSVELTRVD